MKKVLFTLLLIVTGISGSFATCTFSISPSPTVYWDYSFSYYSNWMWNETVSWDFGDGSVGQDHFTSHQYSAPGSYQVCITVIDSLGQTACSVCSTLVVPQLSNACTMQIVPGSSPGVYTGTGSASNSNNTLNWSFGDGHSMSGTSVSNTYATAGNYQACMYEVDPNGAVICSKCITLTVLQGSTTSNCSFSFQPDSVQLHAFHFTGNPFHSGAAVTWNFGDGTTDSGLTVYHQFTGTGSFQTCMTCSYGGQTCTFCDSVYINPNPPSCNFQYTASATNAWQLWFDGLCTPGTSASWDFGDGQTATANALFHTYQQPGWYTVCMSRFDSSGTMTCFACQQVYISQQAPCSYISLTDSVNTNEVHFYAQLTHGGSGVSWDFGDGAQGSGPVTSHIYASTGMYYVCMHELDSVGVSLCDACDSVTVNGIPPSGCWFTATPCNFNNPFNLCFSPQGTVSGTVFTWDFGDNTGSNNSNPVHQYAQAGTYTVCMQEFVSGTTTLICSSCQSVTVVANANPCHAHFVSSNNALTGQFVDLSTGTTSGTQYHWDFGDGYTSVQCFPLHTFAAPGYYTVCLSISDTASACVDTACQSIFFDTTAIGPGQCNAFFAILPIAPFQVAVVNLSTGQNVNYMWDFGDGASVNLAYPTHVYSATGTYLLCLSVSDGWGCISSYCDTLNVDSMGMVYRSQSGFTLNIIPASSLNGVSEPVRSVQFPVYPNPTDGDLYVPLAATSDNECTYRLLSAEGAEIKKGLLSGNPTKINTSSLTPGVYLIEIRDKSGELRRQKIIKQ